MRNCWRHTTFFSHFFPAGKALAIKYGVKYIETSPGINHNVDELLVGMLTQIKLRIAENARQQEMQVRKMLSMHV